MYKIWTGFKDRSQNYVKPARTRRTLACKTRRRGRRRSSRPSRRTANRWRASSSRPCAVASSPVRPSRPRCQKRRQPWPKMRARRGTSGWRLRASSPRAPRGTEAARCEETSAFFVWFFFVFFQISVGFSFLRSSGMALPHRMSTGGALASPRRNDPTRHRELPRMQWPAKVANGAVGGR